MHECSADWPLLSCVYFVLISSIYSRSFQDARLCSFSIWRGDESRLELFHEGAAVQIRHVLISPMGSFGSRFVTPAAGLSNSSSAMNAHETKRSTSSSLQTLSSLTANLSISSSKTSSFLPIALHHHTCAECSTSSPAASSGATNRLSNVLSRRPIPFSHLSLLSPFAEFDIVALIVAVTPSKSLPQKRMLAPRRSEDDEGSVVSDKHGPQDSSTAFCLFCIGSGVSPMLRIDVRSSDSVI
jgi:hypothetical protein